MATVREIAEFAGVSKSTVSLVLNDQAGVSAAMQRKVLDAVEQLRAGATRPQSASTRTLSREQDSRTLSIVVLHPPVLRSSQVFSEVLQGIQSAAEMHHVQLRLIANDPQASPQHVSQLYFSDPSLRPDGVIVFGAKQDEPLLEEARRLGIACVVLGRDATQYEVSGIGRDEERYAYEATQYLLDLGHYAVMFVGGEAMYDYVLNRMKGYRRALRDANVTTEAAWIQLGDGAKAAQTLLEDCPEMTAVLFVNDSYAAEGLPVFQAAGLKIPADLSVVSFDDTDVARSFSPPLTSVSYRRYEEGQWAVKMLVEQIRFPFIETIHTVFQAELIRRESCAPPRA